MRVDDVVDFLEKPCSSQYRMSELAKKGDATRHAGW